MGRTLDYWGEDEITSELLAPLDYWGVPLCSMLRKGCGKQPQA